MRIVIAPDKFKGACSAQEAADAIAAAVRDLVPSAQIITCPMADGGEGTVASMVAATSGKLLRQSVCGPLPGMSVEAEYGMLGDGRTAVIEMAAASGMALIPAEQRSPMRTTTFGTGELIASAVAQGARKIILGIGGSATVDGGVGALQALGFRFELHDGSTTDRPLTGGDLGLICKIEPPAARSWPEILIACDVQNPLYGPDGAAAVFGPQKGATPADVKKLDSWLRSWALRANAVELANGHGSGAAGGLGFGLCALIPAARLTPGFALVAQACGFPEKLDGAQLCITAEGRFDRSSLKGKTAVGVAQMCRERRIPCLILAGSVEPEAEAELAKLGAVAFPISEGPTTLEEAMRQTPHLLRRTTARILRVATQTINLK